MTNTQKAQLLIYALYCAQAMLPNDGDHVLARHPTLADLKDVPHDEALAWLRNWQSDVQEIYICDDAAFMADQEEILLDLTTAPETTTTK